MGVPRPDTAPQGTRLWIGNENLIRGKTPISAYGVKQDNVNIKTAVGTNHTTLSGPREERRSVNGHTTTLDIQLVMPIILQLV